MPGLACMHQVIAGEREPETASPVDQPPVALLAEEAAELVQGLLRASTRVESTPGEGRDGERGGEERDRQVKLRRKASSSEAFACTASCISGRRSVKGKVVRSRVNSRRIGSRRDELARCFFAPLLTGRVGRGEEAVKAIKNTQTKLSWISDISLLTNARAGEGGQGQGGGVEETGREPLEESSRRRRDIL